MSKPSVEFILAQYTRWVAIGSGFAADLKDAGQQEHADALVEAMGALFNLWAEKYGHEETDLAIYRTGQKYFPDDPLGLNSNADEDRPQFPANDNYSPNGRPH